jgi:hypothetical protein
MMYWTDKMLHRPATGDTIAIQKTYTKPHIRLLNGSWYCFLHPIEPVYIGQGTTPYAAYHDWEIGHYVDLVKSTAVV